MWAGQRLGPRSHPDSQDEPRDLGQLPAITYRGLWEWARVFFFPKRKETEFKETRSNVC